MSSPVALHMDFRSVPIGSLVENEWNPNVMDDKAYRAEKESVREFGFIDPVTVRDHPTEDGCFEIIDGAHRTRVVLEAAENDPNQPISVNVLKVSDAEAQKLTIILNETRGRPDKVKLSKLLADLKDDYGDDLGTALPYSPGELNEMVSLASVDWGAYEDSWSEEQEYDPEPEPSAQGVDTGGWKTVQVRMTIEDYEAFMEAHNLVGQASGGLSDYEDVAAGQVVAALAAEYIAGYSHEDHTNEED